MHMHVPDRVDIIQQIYLPGAKDKTEITLGTRPGTGMIIAGAQVRSVWSNPSASLEKAEPWVRAAAGSGASLICFPEQYATGWDPASGDFVQDKRGSIASGFRHLAREFGIAVLGSFREQGVQRPRNTCIVFDEDGEEIASYAKCHLFSPAHEEDHYEPGNDLGIFPLDGLSCGIAICYDLRFADLFRISAERGVHAMLVPAAWPASRIGHWELFIRARAIDHQMYIIGINTTGETPVDSYCGTSIAADPRGAVIARAGTGEELLIAGIERETVLTVRKTLPVIHDRRPDMYTRLSGGE